MAFPLNPTNGQQYTNGLGNVWKYVLADTAWKFVGTSGGGTITGLSPNIVPVAASSTSIVDSIITAGPYYVMVGPSETSAFGVAFDIQDVFGLGLRTAVGNQNSSGGVGWTEDITGAIVEYKGKGSLADSGVLPVVPSKYTDYAEVLLGYIEVYWREVKIIGSFHSDYAKIALYGSWSGISISNQLIGVVWESGAGIISLIDEAGKFCCYIKAAASSSTSAEIAFKNNTGNAIQLIYNFMGQTVGSPQP